MRYGQLVRNVKEKNSDGARLLDTCQLLKKRVENERKMLSTISIMATWVAVRMVKSLDYDSVSHCVVVNSGLTSSLEASCSGISVF